MRTTALERIGERLKTVGASGSFVARRTTAVDDLSLEVRGLGRVPIPVSRSRAQRLCRLARPARYGQGEKTLLDSRVRDTWQIPKSRVKIDRRRWNRTLRPMLEKLRGDLGLPDGCRLKAELHNLLVYAPGQFFKRHQDSEKADDMVGTLVVILPSSFRGGALVVEHLGEKVTCRASKDRLTFVAFYADCHHEVRPVKEGYRVVLTYNLVLDGDPAQAAASSPAVEALSGLLHEHFETPLPPRRYSPPGSPPREPPNRLVYLLDHQYTERGLSWNRLKGDDAARSAVLRAAAESEGFEAFLALADVHETWSCFEDAWEPSRGWYYDDEDDWDDEEDEDDDRSVYGEAVWEDPSQPKLEELLDWDITLRRWLDRSGKAEPIVTRVSDEEVCSTKPSSSLEPYATEYEGYTGNAGNTMDRWYRRGAVVVWPRERAFVIRAEASPAWALKTLKRRLASGAMAEAREMAESLLPFWKSTAANEERRGFFGQALLVAEALDDSSLAGSLLEPFRLEMLTPAQAQALVALAKRYGDGWLADLLSQWTSSEGPWLRPSTRDRGDWLAGISDLCGALRASDEVVGTGISRHLLRTSWEWLKGELTGWRNVRSLKWRDEILASSTKPVQGLLEGIAIVEATDLRDEILDVLCADDNDVLIPHLVKVLRKAVKTVAPARREAVGVDAIKRHCMRHLETRLERPIRAPDDWSIVLPPGCDCELCQTLGTFLADASATQLEWPINERSRKHVHRRIDDQQLPVAHRTRRTGSPYTLVLTKTKDLFAGEAAERRSWQADLKWLARLSGGTRKG